MMEFREIVKTSGGKQLAQNKVQWQVLVLDIVVYII